MNSPSPLTVRSMTGQGFAARNGDLGRVSVEVRTVNHRGFKCSLRTSEGLTSLDSKIEALARSLIHRGSILLNVSYRPPTEQTMPLIDQAVLQAYYRQLHETRRAVDGEAAIDLATLMTLPGVIVASRPERGDEEAVWEFISGGIVEAFENLNEMRSIEGANMATSLHADCERIEICVQRIAKLAPKAIEHYRQRLTIKIERLLAEHQIEAQPIDLLRETQIYADRIDVSEEITRLESHLKMFRSVLHGNGQNLAISRKEESSAPVPASVPQEREPTGRKLDFVVQEMFRETNTIGSKSADASISALVVEVKCAIERMRELVQNLE